MRLRPHGTDSGALSRSRNRQVNPLDAPPHPQKSFYLTPISTPMGYQAIILAFRYLFASICRGAAGRPGWFETELVVVSLPSAHPVSCGDARRAARTYAAGSGGGREQRAGGRADHGKQQQTRSHVRAAGVGEGGWAGPGGREAEAQCASPGPPPTPAAAGRRGCGVNQQPNHT